jgi:AbrB family looped-hinge helix DNA binding protein
MVRKQLVRTLSRATDAIARLADQGKDVSPNNQIVIPREARQALGLKAGDELLVIVRGGSVVALQKPVSHHAAIRGLGRGKYSEE